jgi:hypothetical protein
MTYTATIARRWIAQAVTGMTGNTGDPHSAYHDPLEALRSLAAIGAAVRRAEQDAARAAREQEKTWTDIGEATGFADPPQPGMTSVAEHAFHRFASDIGSGPSVVWRCRSCGELVSDHGPELGNPADAERGHAEGCARLAGAVAAWDAQWDESGDEAEVRWQAIEGVDGGDDD